MVSFGGFMMKTLALSCFISLMCLSVISGVPEDVAREAMRKAGHKLPMRTKFVKRDNL